MKATRETSFISSGTDSAEYKLIKQLTYELRTAIQDDLHDISDHLLSCGMITQESHEDFTDCHRSSKHHRATSLMRAVQNKIKLDHHYYSDFIKVLEKNKQYYDSILQKIYSHNMDSPPTYSQYHKYEENSDESDETGTLLRRVPYVQFEDEPCHEHGDRPELLQRLSNTISVCLSSCIDTVICLLENAVDRPLITIFVLFIICVLLVILLAQLSNVTTMLGAGLVILLFIVLLMTLMCLFLLVCHCFCTQCCKDFLDD